jgi:hypothetical protein
MRTMNGFVTKTGIPGIGPIPWGSHFCHFFKTRDDLLHSLIPFFIVGLEDQELCVWVTSSPLGAEDARTELERSYPEAAGYLKEGRIRILDHRTWYETGGSEPEESLRVWEEEALSRGLRGLRCAGNCSWLTPTESNSFNSYERRLGQSLRDRRIIALCSYDLGRCKRTHISKAIRLHHFSLGRQDGDWELIETVLDSRRHLL